jgi:hypothetical protein
MANYDFQCKNEHIFEITCTIAERNNSFFCPECQEPGKRVFLSFPMVNDPNNMILEYPGSKKLKAGYVHSHGDRPAEKTSSGWGGIIQGGNKKHHDPIANGVVIDK